MDELVNLNPIKEFRNVCEKCGKVNTLFPTWVGKKRLYRCETKEGGCGRFSKGITETEAINRNINIIR